MGGALYLLLRFSLRLTGRRERDAAAVIAAKIGRFFASEDRHRLKAPPFSWALRYLPNSLSSLA
jgi:hypothetical protein